MVEKQHNERRRNAASKEAILTATYTMLNEVGFDGLTIEGVSAHAKVGKTTIYRWWSSKGALAVEAFLVHFSPVIAYKKSGSARVDILTQMHILAQMLAGSHGRVVREIVAAGQGDSETLAMFREGFLSPRRQATKEVLQAGISRGEFREDIDFEVVIDALYGPIHHRLMSGRLVVDDRGFVDCIGTMVLDAIAAMYPQRQNN